MFLITLRQYPDKIKEYNASPENLLFKDIGSTPEQIKKHLDLKPRQITFF